jgi:phage repressor protein C with HTH and peptisase S24 domain
MVTGDSFSRRLRLIMQQFGSIADLAKAVQVSDNAIYKWVAGRGQPSMTSLVNLAQAAGVSVEWLATGKGAGAFDEIADRDLAPLVQPSDLIAIPKRPLPGPPASNLAPVTFNPAWLRKRLAITPADTMLIEVAGDSMTPTLNHGDLALIDKRRTRFDHDALYALSIDDEISVRRLQRTSGNTILVSGDNPSYKALPIPLADLQIAGKVVLICRCV